jgi:hypothetical protein
LKITKGPRTTTFITDALEWDVLEAIKHRACSSQTSSTFAATLP